MIHAAEIHLCEQRLDVEQWWVSPHWAPSTAETLVVLVFLGIKNQVLEV